MSGVIFLEGGGETNAQNVECRNGFRALLESAGLKGRMPRLFACGGRNSTYHEFSSEHSKRRGFDYVAMLIDSEEPLDDLNDAWRHLAARDKWQKPEDATDDQILFMTTCMETWISADRNTLSDHYGHALHEGNLPPLSNLENRSRQSIQEALIRATRDCTNAYAKGKESYKILGKLDPKVLAEHLPSFVRMKKILIEKL